MIDFVYQTLANLGYSHPLHPPITHIPMGMAMGGFIFAIGALLLKKDDLARAAHYCYTLALIFVVPTIVLGYMDWQHRFDGELSGLFITKIVLALVFTALLLVAFVTGKNVQTDIKKKLVIYALCLIVATGLGFTGGQIQYG